MQTDNSRTAAPFTGADFYGVASIFDEIWGWELEGAAQAERARLALFYTAAALASGNWARVVREQPAAPVDDLDDAGRVLAFLCADIKGIETPAYDRAGYARLALFYRQALEETAAGREILDFYARIEAVNADLLGQLRSRAMGWDAELKLLITAPAARGRGCAGMLTRACFEDVRANRGRWCMLLTDTHCAWQYYEKTGWSQDARRPWGDDSGITGFAYRKDVGRRD